LSWPGRKLLNKKNNPKTTLKLARDKKKKQIEEIQNIAKTKKPEEKN